MLGEKLNERGPLSAKGGARGSSRAPTPGGFSQRVRKRLKIKALSFSQVEKSAQGCEKKGDRLWGIGDREWKIGGVPLSVPPPMFL